MSVAARVTAVDQTSWGDHVEQAWLVTVEPDRPTSWAPDGVLQFVAQGSWSDPAPCAVGDQVDVPVHCMDGHVVLRRASGDTKFRMLGGIVQPGTPVGWSGHRDEFGRDR